MPMDVASPMSLSHSMPRFLITNQMMTDGMSKIRVFFQPDSSTRKESSVPMRAGMTYERALRMTGGSRGTK